MMRFVYFIVFLKNLKNSQYINVDVVSLKINSHWTHRQCRMRDQAKRKIVTAASRAHNTACCRPSRANFVRNQTNPKLVAMATPPSTLISLSFLCVQFIRANLEVPTLHKRSTMTIPVGTLVVRAHADLCNSLRLPASAHTLCGVEPSTGIFFFQRRICFFIL